MKKQILFIAIISTAVLFSCSKEKMETGQSQSLDNGAIAKTSSAQTSIIPIDPGLVGRFEFNGNLEDQTGKLANGISTGRGVSYTTDRKGNAASALNLTGYYGVTLKDLPEQTKASIAVWVKSPSRVDYRTFISASASGISFDQAGNTYYGGEAITTIGGLAMSFGAGTANNQWHHLAVTYDGINIRTYTDGILIGTAPFAGSFAQYLADYRLGYVPGVSGFWNGCLDDLRFYSRILSASEIQAMASL